MRYVLSRINATGLHQMTQHNLLARFGLLTTATILLSCGTNNRTEAIQHSELRDVALQFVPESATDIRDAEGIPWVQLNFQLHGDFSNDLFGRDKVAQKVEEGWRACSQPKG